MPALHLRSISRPFGFLMLEHSLKQPIIILQKFQIWSAMKIHYISVAFSENSAECPPLSFGKNLKSNKKVKIITQQNHAVPSGTCMVLFRLDIVFWCNCFFFKEIIKDFLFIMCEVCASTVSVFSKLYLDYIFDSSRSCGHNHDTIC